MSVEMIVKCVHMLTHRNAVGRGFGKYEKAFGAKEALQVPRMDSHNILKKLADIRQ